MRARTRLLFSGVVLVAVAAGGAAVYAQQKRTPKLSADDWIEIRQLYSRYPTYLDQVKDDATAEKFANLWVEDGVWDISPTGPPNRGRTAIIASAMASYKRGFQGPDTVRRHYSSINVLIDPSPEGAVGTSYFAMMKSGAQDNQPSEVEMNGVYNDIFVKTKDGWKFKSRTFRRGPGQAPAAPAR